MNIVNEDLLLTLTDCDTLDEIRVISLRNKQLTQGMRQLSECENLTILYLQNNLLNLKDMHNLQYMQNLKKIDLSDNQLTSLPPASVFAGLKNLQFLYLHQNNIQKWQDLQSLTSMPSILHITLFSNPVCNIPGYRHFMVNSVPGLKALDYHVITDEERIEDASFGYRFRGLNEFMKLYIPDYTQLQSAERHLISLDVDVYRLKRIFERNSPSILIQSLYRGYKSRHADKIFFNERKSKIIIIQKVVRGWLKRLKIMRDLKSLLEVEGDADLLLTNKEIAERNAEIVIKREVLKWYKKLTRERGRNAAALKIQKFYKGRFDKNSSFINALNLSKTPCIYFLKEQRPQFMKILKSQQAILEQENLTLTDAIGCIREDNKYETIRVEEPDLFKYQPLPLLQFAMPSSGKKTIIRANKSLGLDKEENKEQNKQFTLNKYFFTDAKDDTDRQLRELKRRMCHFNVQKLKKDIQTKQKKTFLNQMVFYDRYNDFMVFESPSVRLVLQLLFAILDYNRTLNPHEDQQFLCFFEPLLQRQAAATRIQQAFRAYKFRSSMPQDKLPIYKIIKMRAAYCIQSWWSNMKLRKRLKALSNIRKHALEINTSEIYIEQTLYQQIEQVVGTAAHGFRFEEQSIMFDFNPTTYGIHMQVEEDMEFKQQRRFDGMSVPHWLCSHQPLDPDLAEVIREGDDNDAVKTAYINSIINEQQRTYGVVLRPPDMLTTPYCNNLMALFHFNQGDCEILPATKCVDYTNCQMDIDRNIYFCKISCSSVEEARKRAIVMAYLTYDMTRHLFVKMSTSKMLEDPYIFQNTYDCHEMFDLEIEEDQDGVDVKTLLVKQAAQRHQGVILTDKDAAALQANTKFKSVEVNEKFLNISVKDLQEERTLEREISNFQAQQEGTQMVASSKLAQLTNRNSSLDEIKAASMKTDIGDVPKMTLWEARRLNEQHMELLKEQRQLENTQEAQLFRMEKQDLLQIAQQESLDVQEAQRTEITKQREIKKIIKNEQGKELDKNLKLFLNLNNEERLLRQELADKQVELQSKEKTLKRANVVQQNKQKLLKKMEREKFVSNFSQAKNLIEKQMKIGMFIREKKQVKTENQKKVITIKDAKKEAKISEPVKACVFGAFPDPQDDQSTQLSSAHNIHAQSVMADFGPPRQPLINQSFDHQHSVYQTATKPLEPMYNSAQSKRKGVHLSANRNKSFSGRNGLLPPMHETSFSEQYMIYKAMGDVRGQQGPLGIGQKQQTFQGMPTDLDMTSHVKRIAQASSKNKPNLHRKFQAPVFAEEIMNLGAVTNPNEDAANVFKITSPRYQIPVQGGINNFTMNSNTRSGGLQQHSIMYNQNATSTILPPIGGMMGDQHHTANYTHGQAFSVGSLNGQQEHIDSASNSAFNSPMPPRNVVRMH